MGIALGTAFRRAGYRVHFGSRTPQASADRLRRIDPPFAVADWPRAAQEADIVVLALLWSATTAIPELAEVTAGKIVVSCTNAETAGGLQIPLGLSATETIARALPAAKVVAAFNHVYAELLEEDVVFDGGRPSVFLCGDDEESRSVVASLVTAIGLDPVDVGRLNRASLVESLAALIVTLVRDRGAAPASNAFRLAREISRVPAKCNSEAARP